MTRVRVRTSKQSGLMKNNFFNVDSILPHPNLRMISQFRIIEPAVIGNYSRDDDRIGSLGSARHFPVFFFNQYGTHWYKGMHKAAHAAGALSTACIVSTSQRYITYHI